MLPITLAILKFYSFDFGQICDFYELACLNGLEGINPEIDAILDEIDAWLISFWPSAGKYSGLTDVSDWSTEL